MKTWKLISGIINCVLFFFITLQSCAAGTANALKGNGSSSGTIGLMVAICILIIGISNLITRKEEERNWVVIVPGLLVIILGLSGMETFPDLGIWAFWGLINAGVELIGTV